MKIGGITFWWSKNNYGQVLQCYALQKIFLKEGHDPFLIRFGGNPAPKKRTKTYVFALLLRRTLKCLNPVALAKYLHSRRERKFARLERSRARAFEAEDRRNFDGFRETNIRVSNRRYNSLKELLADPPLADIYAVGSDVVWSTVNDAFGDWHRAMFLDFGSSETARISYAASFGASDFGKEYLSAIAPYLKKFSAVSVRESTGVEICRKAGRTDAVHVLDPTCLLDMDAYLEVAAAVPSMREQKCFFFYGLNFDEADDVHYAAQRDFCRSRGCRFVATLSDGMNLAYDRLPGAEYSFDSIPEWLAHYRDSKYVVTNSFHGVVFAVLFEKQFLLLPLKGRYAVLNARPNSFLSALGLSRRIYEGGDFSAAMDAPIDWASVREKLSALREQSLEFLRTALAKCEEEIRKGRS